MVALAVWACLAGCSPGRPPATDVDRAYADIQVYEARLDRARHALDEGDEACPRPCGIALQACDQSRALCDLAQRVGEEDALVRCERARLACRRVKVGALTACRCDFGAE